MPNFDQEVLFENGRWAPKLGEITVETPGGASTLSYENGMIRLYNGVSESKDSNMEFRFVFEYTIDIRGYDAVIIELEDIPAAEARGLIRCNIDEDTRSNYKTSARIMRMRGGMNRQRLRGVGALPAYGQSVRIKKIHLEGDGVISKPATINARNILDIIPPRTGNTPVNAITSSLQYTGTVEWNPNHATFQTDTEYTATITLTPRHGWTLNGLGSVYK